MCIFSLSLLTTFVQVLQLHKYDWRRCRCRRHDSLLPPLPSYKRRNSCYYGSMVCTVCVREHDSNSFDTATIYDIVSVSINMYYVVRANFAFEVFTQYDICVTRARIVLLRFHLHPRRPSSDNSISIK